jgi:hypothetical protein
LWVPSNSQKFWDLWTNCRCIPLYSLFFTGSRSLPETLNEVLCSGSVECAPWYTHSHSLPHITRIFLFPTCGGGAPFS